jgi:RimJ/RimL family protein N-acetyltransferase
VRDWPAAELLLTPRLRLEPLRVEHAAEMVAVLADPALYLHTGGAAPSIAELTARYRRQVVGTSPDGGDGWLNWVLRRDPAEPPVGTVQATVRGDGPERRAELAWVIARAHQGQGLATEAASAVMRWLQGHGVRSFEAHIRPGHRASGGVARHLGMEATSGGRGGETRWATPGD